MRTSRIDLVLWTAFGIVAVVAGIVGVMMLASPGSTDDYFSWALGPEPLAAQVGGFYVASTVVFGLAIRRPWNEVRGLVVAVLALTLPTLIATLIHSEVFDFSRPIAVIWLLLFVGSPLTYGTILWLRRNEELPATTPLPPAARTLFRVLAVAFVGGALLCWFARDFADHLVPLSLAPMGSAFLGAWSLFLAALCASVGTVDESRIPLIGLVAYPIGVVFAGLTTYDDFDGAGWAWMLLFATIAAAALATLMVSEIGGRRLPFLRWSFLRLVFGIRKLEKNWQVGDGREAALAEYVTANARAGDVDDAIRAADEFCYSQSFMINVGDEKGAILDAAIERAQPRRLLELGTYCGYSALRTARVMPADAHLYSIEFLDDNAEIARRILTHAGVGDRVTVVVGMLGDGGATIAALEQHGFDKASLDFAFIDHAKDAYLPDLERILERGWLRPGAVVVADNVKFPGAPEYQDHMRAHEGTEWRTTEHETHVEYQSIIKDLVLESEYLGDGDPGQH